jgi:DNA helicase-2/ATP-dependent DNA helicase PcrA
MVEYEILGNWRSTNQIVGLLNTIRPNLTQQPLRNISGSTPTIIVGDKASALATIANRYQGLDVISLCRENTTANALQRGLGINVHNDLLQQLKSADSTSDRRRIISDSIKAIEYARLGYFKDALKTLGRSFNRNKTLDNQKQTLEALKKLLDNYGSFANGNLSALVNFVRTNIKIVSALRSGRAFDFYSSTPYTHAAIAVKNLYETGTCRTIHKSKGDEFECVLVVLEARGSGAFNENTGLSFLLNPDLLSNEEHRVNYVALSRAQNHLYISTPTLSATNEISLKSLGFDVERLL